jgi:hypothetical protein
MPLYANAVDLIRANFEQISQGRKVKAIPIGTLTERQLGAINQSRQSRLNPLPAIIAEVLFIGQHIYNSRVVRDGYTIDDVVDQIVSAMDSRSVFIPTSRAATIQNHQKRVDCYGNTVQDMAVFECTAKHPRPELFSVIAKGDTAPNLMRAKPKDERPLD